MEAQSTTYCYAPLDEARRQIRLLHLQPRRSDSRPETQVTTSDQQAVFDDEGDEDSDDNVIACSFSLASLDNPPDYEALSYVWGDPKDVHPISLEEHHFPITKNLMCALQNLRNATEERILWVDALCINQGSPEERSSQVMQMQYIYQSASRVVVSLGPIWEGHDIAMDYIAMVGSNGQLHWDPSLEPHASCHGMDMESSLLSTYLGKFFKLPWFHRTWTIQEIALARAAVFFCGQHILDKASLLGFMGSYTRHTGQCCVQISVLNSGAVLRLGHDTKVLLHSASVDHHGFLILLAAVRSHQSSDDRDKIYGLLSLADVTTQEHLRPDYNVTAAEAYISLVEASVTTKSLDIFSCVAGSGRLELSLRSFVPDWTSALDALANMLVISRIGDIFSGIYSASNGSTATLRILESGHATTQCCIIDTICGIEEHGNTATHLANFARLAECHADQTPSESRLAAFRRALCGDTIYVSGRAARRAMEADLHMYEKWKTFLHSPYNYQSLELFQPYFTAHGFVSKERVFCVTERGYIGWAPLKTAVGDVVVVLPGGRVPYVLRETKTNLEPAHLGEEGGPALTFPKHVYRFLGDAYLQGFMDGEGYAEETLVEIMLV